MAIFNGTSANDILGGTDQDDTIDGGQGADFMFGGLGNDTYFVDNVGDQIFEDTNQGTADTVLVSVQNYTLNSNIEIGFVEVFNGTLTGNDGANTLFGFVGNDTLYGLGGNDQLTGGLGNDVLDGGIGIDTMTGGYGDDTYYVDNSQDVVIEGLGTGYDTVVVHQSFALSDNIESASASADNVGVTINGNGLGNLITGGDLDDDLSGGGGADTLIGGAGSDSLDSGVFRGQGDQAIDNLIGGGGNDSYYVASGDVVIENANEGNDLIIAFDDYILPDNVESLHLSGSGRDPGPVSGTGNALDNEILGDANANILRGLDGADFLGGDFANDTLDGGAGNDTLDGGTGADTMLGGAGNDTYFIDNTGDVVTELVGEGHDTVSSSINYVLGANLEDLMLTGTAGIGQGNADSNKIYGNSAGNFLYGLGGADTLSGDAGTDRLEGGSGNDSLDGGADNDVLVGGAGNDMLTGGSGADRFTYAYGEGNDTVRDFSVKAGDVLELDARTIGIGDFAHAMKDAHQVGSSVVFDFGAGQQITLLNTLLGDLNIKNVIVD